MLRDKNDEDWDMWHMWHELTTRRPMEKSIGYAESHDQALVGDKTLIFWLADKEMYWHMTKNDGNMIIERSIALHKMIRFLTLILAGEGYLNFIGNEFGHPEWVDFPRQGNNWSYKYAKRQWSLVDNENLRYDYLNNFDREMLTFVKTYNVLGALDLHSLWIDNNENIIVFRKGGLIFLFNFHPTNSFPEYGIPTHEAGEYQVVFNSDRDIFGGFSRIPQDIIYKTRKLPDKGNADGVVLYSPSRTVLVIKKI
jgi:1,4-alpha-glucan branching enzyme